MLARVDLLCVPTFPAFVTLDEIAADPIGPNARLGTYTNFVNLLGLCGLAVPTPARADGRPGSVTLLARGGPRRADREPRARDRAAREPDASARPAGRCRRRGRWPTGAAADEIEVAVCGAHMSGLPLNGELTGLGGRFLRAVRTAPVYRLYALAGGPPRRPGMVRGAGRRGDRGRGLGAAEGGVRRLHRAGAGAARRSGRWSLSDGTRPKGFLCEPAGVVGAEDVTAVGDWRQVVAEVAA